MIFVLGGGQGAQPQFSGNVGPDPLTMHISQQLPSTSLTIGTTIPFLPMVSLMSGVVDAAPMVAKRVAVAQPNSQDAIV